MEQLPIIATLGGHSMGTTWSVRLVVAATRDRCMTASTPV